MTARMVRPCPDCPWRTDAPVQQFTADRYACLANTSRQDDEHGGHDASYDAPLFACHATPEGAEKACAGWLATEGLNHVGVRVAVAFGRLDPQALRPGKSWPELYPSFISMVEAQRFEEQ